MAEAKKIVRLSKAAREFNISMNTIIGFLEKKGFKMESSPNTKLVPEMYELLINEFQAEKAVKESAHKKGLEFIGKETISIEDTLIKEKPVIQEEFVASDELFIANANVDFDTTAKAKKEEIIPHEE